MSTCKRSLCLYSLLYEWIFFHIESADVFVNTSTTPRREFVICGAAEEAHALYVCWSSEGRRLFISPLPKAREAVF